MTLPSRTLLLASLLGALAACSADEPPPPPTAAAQPAQPLPNSNVFSTDIKALNKAKDVQKTVDQQKAEMDKKLDDEGG